MGDESSDVMTDADFEKALDALREQEPNGEVGELLKMMNENRMISWEEAEQILGGSSYNEPIKSSLPEQTRPSEPDNDTDVDVAIQRLIQNDPKLKEVNLNNMKRTPIPQVKRLIEAIRDNKHLEKLSLANMGLYDSNVEPLIDVVENNDTLKSINLETNYLSGDFFAKIFQAALKNQTLEEVKAVNQGVTFSTTSEKEIIDAIFENRGIIKVSINLRLPEGRHKIENAMIRNGEIKRVLRRQAAQAARAAAEEEAKKAESATKSTTDKTKTDEVTKPKKAPSTVKKTATSTTPAKPPSATAPTPAKPIPPKTAAAPKTSLAKTPASDGTTADTTKKVVPKVAPKDTTKGTTSSTKAPVTKTPAEAKPAADKTPSNDKPAGTKKKLVTSTAKPSDAAGTTEKPKTKPAPAVPPKKKTVTKKAAEKSDTAEGEKEGEAAAATKPGVKTSGTPSSTSKTSTTPKKTAISSTKTSSDAVSEPSKVYPLKKTSTAKETK